MVKMIGLAALAAMVVLLSEPCVAADASAVPEAKKTTLGLYLTSEEVPPFLAEAKGRRLFVDVRTPAELAASGVATGVDANAPVVLPAGGGARPNPDFVAEVESRLTAQGLSKGDWPTPASLASTT